MGARRRRMVAVGQARALRPVARHGHTAGDDARLGCAQLSVAAAGERTNRRGCRSARRRVREDRGRPREAWLPPGSALQHDARSVPGSRDRPADARAWKRRGAAQDDVTGNRGAGRVSHRREPDEPADASVPREVRQPLGRVPAGFPIRNIPARTRRDRSASDPSGRQREGGSVARDPALAAGRPPNPRRHAG